MATTVSINLDDVTYNGRATNMDGLFMAGLILPNYFEIRDNEKGLRKAFEEFSEENAETLSDNPDKADEMYDTWGERLLIRLTNNLDIRDAFAQRMTEIFPTLPSTYLSFNRWSDKQGNTHSRSDIRLDLDQCMSCVTNVLNVLEKQKPASKPSEPTAKSPKGFQPSPKNKKMTAQQAKREALEAQLAALDTEEEVEV